jgi:hypothetical protein
LEEAGEWADEVKIVILWRDDIAGRMGIQDKNGRG